MTKKIRKLTATWTFESPQDLDPLKMPIIEDEPTGPLTREQEADLIIKRLKQTPQERQAEERARDEEKLVKILAAEIVREIDEEMLKGLKGESFDKKA
jgi:hypothetical protein